MADSQLRQATGGTGGAPYTYDAAVGDVYMTLFLKSIGAGQFSQISQDERQKALEALTDIHNQIGPEQAAQAQQAASEFLVNNAQATASTATPTTPAPTTSACDRTGASCCTMATRAHGETCSTS